MKKDLKITLSEEDLSLDACKFFYRHEQHFYDAFGWVESTKIAYTKYINLLANSLSGIPLRESTFEVFDAAVKSVNNFATKKYSETTLNSFRSVINDICYFAEVYSHGKYQNVLWGTIWHENTTSSTASSNKTAHRVPPEKQITDRLALPKSLTLPEEIRLASLIVNKAEKNSFVTGLAIMFYLGLRPGECAGLTYGCIRPLEGYPNVNCLYVISQLRGSGIHTSSLKTENAYRVLPIPTELSDALQKRMKYLSKRGLAPAELPIICANENAELSTPCNPKLFMEFCKNTLRLVKVKEAVLLGMASDVRVNKQEAAATSYLLRRNLATALHGACGMDNDEIKYIMGHAIHTPEESRRDYLNADTLFRLWNVINIHSFFTVSNHRHTITAKPLNLHRKDAELTITPEYLKKHNGRVMIQVRNTDVNDRIRLIVQEGNYSDIQALVAPVPAGKKKAPRVRIHAEYSEAIVKSINRTKSKTEK